MLRPAISRIILVDAPSVLGWERWREIGLRYGMGMVQALLTHAMSIGRIPEQPVEPLAHVFIGALDEATLYAVRHADRDAGTGRGAAVLRAMIDSFARRCPSGSRGTWCAARG